MCELEVLMPMHTCGSLRMMSGVFLHAPLRSPLRQGLLLTRTPVSSQDLPVSTQPLWGAHVLRFAQQVLLPIGLSPRVP